MKKIDLAVYAILIIVAGIGFYMIYGLINGNSNLKNEQNQALNFQKISTGSTNAGDAAIDLTPIKIDDKNLVLNIALNTHSVDLSQFDLKKITILKYSGKTAYPIEAPKIEGHHSSGGIVFNVDGDLKDFAITIKGIPKVEERIYEWKR